MPQSIKSAEELVTPPDKICAGFIAQAKSKADKAQPYVDDAFEFWGVLQDLKDAEAVAELYTVPKYRKALLAAAGYSDKALNNLSKNMSEDDLTEALRAFFAERCNSPQFRLEIFARYLLTRGDTLGGSMRNFVGAEGKEKFKNALIAALDKSNLKYTLKEYDGRIRGIEWFTGRIIQHDKDGKPLDTSLPERRLMVFDTTPRQLGLSEESSDEEGEAKSDNEKKNNVDLILLDSTHYPIKLWRGKESKTQFTLRKKMLFKDARNFLAVGELKSGIDPGGADEHFKTAGSAMVRLRNRFIPFGVQVRTFLVVAAVARAMAVEIFASLQSGELIHAANFTNEEQVNDLTSWLTSL